MSLEASIQRVRDFEIFSIGIFRESDRSINEPEMFFCNLLRQEHPVFRNQCMDGSELREELPVLMLLKYPATCAFG